MTAPARHAYQYVALRCVPRVDREEFLNVGVVLYCHATDYLDAAWHVDPARLGAARRPASTPTRCARPWPSSTRSAPATTAPAAPASAPVSQRFGYLKAPRSTVLQPGPVHGGVTADPARQLERLLHHLVG